MKEEKVYVTKDSSRSKKKNLHSVIGTYRVNIYDQMDITYPEYRLHGWNSRETYWVTRKYPFHSQIHAH